MRKKKLSNVTLVVVLYGRKRATRISTMLAMLKTLSKFEFDEAIYISDVPPLLDIKKVKWIKIVSIKNPEDYSRFMLFSLGDYISSSHALCIQHDGFPLNSLLWERGFLDWDYIGAPWPESHDGVRYTDEEGQLHRVGNGGFSLRSKRLLSLPSKLGLKFGPIHGSINEDGILCCKWNKALKSAGIKYAPVDIAARFSTEEVVKGITKEKSFGFHGLKYMRLHMFFHFFLSRFKL